MKYVFEKNYGWKLPKPKEGNLYLDAESTVDPKQEECKLTYTKTCYN